MEELEKTPIPSEESQEELQKKAQTILEEVDTESRFRHYGPGMTKLIAVLSVIWCVFQLYYTTIGTIEAITICIDKSVPDDVVYQLAKVMYENIDSVKNVHNALRDLTVESAVQNLAGMEIHPGAAKYYKEVGALE